MKNSFTPILHLALPIIAQTFLMHITLIIDRVMVGSLGVEAIAAVGLSGRIFSFLLIIFAAVAGGASILAAQARGAGKDKELRHIISTSLIVGAAAGLCITGVILIFARDILAFLGAEAPVQALGARFLLIASFCAVSFVLNNIMTGILRACGDTRSPLFIGLGCAILATALNVVLIFGGQFSRVVIPPLGAVGAAWSTLVSSVTATLLFARVLVRKTGISPTDFTNPSRLWLKKIGGLGAPITADAFFWQIGQMGFTWIVARLGTNSLAAREILDLFLTNSYILVSGFSAATMTLVGHELGRRQFAQAEELSMQGLKLCFVSIIGTVLLLYGLQNVIIGFFNVSAEVKTTLGTLIICFCILHPFSVPNVVFPYILRSGGDTLAVLAITTSTMIFIGLPLAWIGAHTLGFGIVGAYIGFTIHDLIKGAIFYRRYKSGAWKRSLIGA